MFSQELTHLPGENNSESILGHFNSNDLKDTIRIVLEDRIEKAYNFIHIHLKNIG